MKRDRTRTLFKLRSVLRGASPLTELGMEAYSSVYIWVCLVFPIINIGFKIFFLNFYLSMPFCSPTHNVKVPRRMEYTPYGGPFLKA